ncbi:PAS domain-containing protein [Cupriavidus basilensis]|uniref:PAS domain-containing protein n=1 Tax=Cupriavidus basilensis TaxID=68895 RepID=UPI0023E80E21|nr:PAS domain-containing protein [Cupriavidus basilensis]MDF3884218.1 PAS domain-containing protein [Cupriavidus basilensis]
MGLRWKLFLPAALTGLLLITCLAFGWMPGTRAELALAAAGGVLLMLGAAAAAFHLFLWRPLGTLLQTGKQGPANSRVPSSPLATMDEIGQLKDAFAQLQGRVQTLQQALDLTTERRSQIEVALRSSEERYALAMRTADDGMWEWNLQTGDFRLSQRWKSMLGFDEDELPDTMQAWRQRMHPDDLPVVEAAMTQHLEGSTPRYQQQIRLLHKDGRYRSVDSLASAIRHANGKPGRLVGLDTDVTRIRRVEDILKHVVEGTSGTCGDDFFRALVRHFAGALDVPCAFVTECTGWPPRRVHTLAFWFVNGFRENFEYELAGTPCEAVFNEGLPTFHPEGLGQQFPREKDFESYYGVPILNSERRVIGHMAFLDTRKMREEEVLIGYVYQIFTARAAAEIERKTVLDRLTRSGVPRNVGEPAPNPDSAAGSIATGPH